MPSQVPSYTDRMEQIEQIHEVAKTSLDKAQKMMVIRNPCNKKFRPYQEGDQVWIKGTNLKTLYPLAKLTPKRYGPFKILKQLSPAVYKIKIPHQWKVHSVFHANLIMPYKETTIHGPNYRRPPPDLVDGEEEFEVEQILSMKQMGRGCKTHYLVKWKGCPTSDNSWEPEKNLNTKELITEFKQSSKPKKTKGRKTYLWMTWTVQVNSSPSQLYHHTSSSATEMSSTLGSPATSPVQSSSEPSSPVLSGPLTLELATDRPVSDYQYNGATHCGECHRPKKYNHITW